MLKYKKRQGRKCLEKFLGKGDLNTGIGVGGIGTGTDFRSQK